MVPLPSLEVHELARALTPRPDVVFNLSDTPLNDSSREAEVAALLDRLDLPYTGNPPETLFHAQDKITTKLILQKKGILTPHFSVFNRIREIKEWKKFPAIVKPSREDASIGIDDKAVVFDRGELRARVAYVIRHFNQPALVEEFISGREFNISILEHNGILTFPAYEIDFSGLPASLPPIVSHQAKWVPNSPAYQGTRPVCPAPLSPRLWKEIKKVATHCYRAMNCRDYARVDIRLSPENKVFCLEVNPNPDIGIEGGFARAARVFGFSYQELIDTLVRTAYQRTARNDEDPSCPRN
jgi:D-alanine-D-alanine ligase